MNKSTPEWAALYVSRFWEMSACVGLRLKIDVASVRPLATELTPLIRFIKLATGKAKNCSMPAKGFVRIPTKEFTADPRLPKFTVKKFSALSTPGTPLNHGCGKN